MTLLCAPVKQLIDTARVDLVEIDLGTHKVIYQYGKPLFIDTDWQVASTAGGIVSYHNFNETPNLDEILDMLKKAHPHAALYKIATFAQSTLDSLRMLEFLQRHRNIIGLCMGELGTITRICAPVFGVPVMYAPLRAEDINAPGQLLACQLKEIYHFHRLNRETKIFGLIGDPVHRSPGHLYHNDAFRAQGRNAVYVKMVVQPSELPEFFAYAKKLPFGGLSVTAPLKEAVIPFINEVATLACAMGAVNTVVFKEDKIFGYNTDGEAAMDVLGNVANKTVVILGAGGAAKAIAYMALHRKAHVVIVNRGSDKARSLAEALSCTWSTAVPPYDFLVNATSVSMPIGEENLLPGKTVMEIALYETDFLHAARRRGCHTIDGMPMYFQQAAAQQVLWSAID